MTTVVRIALMFAVMLIAACGGSGGGSTPDSSVSQSSSSSSVSSVSSSSSSSTTTPTYTVGGLVSGLAGSGLVLQNNVGNDLLVAANGAVTFSAALPSGNSYSITIKTQPTNPSQTCSLFGSSSGTITNANVVAASVTCVTDLFPVTATVSGLIGTGLVLQNNAGNDIVVDSNGSATFPAIASGTQYAVTVKRQPINPTPNSNSLQFCSVSSGTGIVGNGTINNVLVSCRPATVRFLYVANIGDSTVSGFAVEAATGALTPIPGSPFHLDHPISASLSIAVQPFGAAIYVNHSSMTVGSMTTSGISAFRVHPTTGALSAMAGSPFATGATSSNNFARFDPTGRFLYVSNSIESKTYIFQTDRDTGVITSGPLASINAPSGTYDRRGNFVFEIATANASMTVHSYLVDPVAGEKIAINSVSTQLTGPLTSSPPNFINSVLDLSGTHLYCSYALYSSVAGFNINPNTGQLSAMSGSPFSIGGIRPTSVALHASGKFVYITDRTANTLNAFSIDQTNGAMTAVGSPVSIVTTGGALTATTERGGYFMFPDQSAIGITRLGPTTPSSAGIFSINPSTGAVAPTPGSPFALIGNKPEVFFYEPSGKYAYLIDSGANNITAYAINASVGSRTYVGTYAVGSAPAISPAVVGRQ